MTEMRYTPEQATDILVAEGFEREAVETYVGQCLSENGFWMAHPTDGRQMYVTPDDLPAEDLDFIRAALVEDTPATADEWADDLDDLTRDAESVGTLVSEGYAAGFLAGVALSTDDPRIDDERLVIVSADRAMVVRYDAQSGYWYPES